MGFVIGKRGAMLVGMNGLSTGWVGFGMGLVKVTGGTEATCRSTGIGGCIIVKLGAMLLSSNRQISILGGFGTGWFEFCTRDCEASSTKLLSFLGICKRRSSKSAANSNIRSIQWSWYCAIKKDNNKLVGGRT